MVTTIDEPGVLSLAAARVRRLGLTLLGESGRYGPVYSAADKPRSLGTGRVAHLVQFANVIDGQVQGSSACGQHGPVYDRPRGMPVCRRCYPT